MLEFTLMNAFCIRFISLRMIGSSTYLKYPIILFQWYVTYGAVSRFYGNISAKTAENGIPYLILHIICSKFHGSRNCICYVSYYSYCISGKFCCVDLFLYIFHMSNLIFISRSLMRRSVFSMLYVSGI
jgi:hypothetical protein